MAGLIRKKGSVWRRENIDHEKKVIKRVLDSFSDPKDKGARLNLILKRLNDCMDSSDPEGQLRRFIYIMSALSHHLQFDGLTKSQVKNLSSLAVAILRSAGIQPSISKLAYLYGELHLILSQIYSKGGDQWEATWQQQLAIYLSAREMVDKGLQLLAAGIRMLRIGQVRLAETTLQEAENSGLSPQFLVRARLERLKALRLEGRMTEATQLAEGTQVVEEITDEERRELDWELKCQHVQKTAEINHLVIAVLKGKSHHFPSYIMEAFLWTRAVASREWIRRFPKFKKLAGESRVLGRANDAFSQIVRTFEAAYDYDVPYSHRLERVGKALSLISFLNSIDKELLVWACAVRWLARARFPQTTELVLNQYQALSLKVSWGKSTDVLCVLRDLEKSFNRSERVSNVIELKKVG